MSSADYWKKREQEAKKATIRDEEEYRKRIETIYKQTYEAVERQINDWYARYASKNGLSMSEARMRVKKLDMERYERLAAKYVATHDFSDQANEEMEIYNLTMRINRLELLKAQINLELLAGYDDLDKELEREFIEQAMKEDRRLAGILGDSVIGNQRYAKQIVNASFWNATYSERIWGNNMPRLRSSIETQLRNGIIQGIHPTELARNLRKSFDVSIRDSERLMITEVRRIQTEIQKDSFDRNGFKEYRFISAGDGKVCPECERLHGQHFKVSEMQPGENAPPMHPVCRCSTAAWMDGEKYKRWLDALERGEDVRWREFEAGEERQVTQTGGKITGGHRYPVEKDDTRKEKDAAAAYEKFARENDSERIAKNTGFTKEDIETIRRHVFYNKHELYVGYKRFPPDYDMAVAWQRLREGNYLPRDILLLQHELLESEIEKKYNLNISEAHARVTKTYDWWGRLEEEIGEEGEPYGILQINRNKR